MFELQHTFSESQKQVLALDGWHFGIRRKKEKCFESEEDSGRCFINLFSYFFLIFLFFFVCYRIIQWFTANIYNQIVMNI